MLPVADRRRAPAKRAVTSTRVVQAAVEGIEKVGDGRKVTFMGQEFKMAQKIGLAPIMMLAMAGSQGVDSADEAGLVALYRVINDCIDESEHARFWQYAVDTKADGDDFMQTVRTVIEALSARPTKSPNG
jgi:hypothetical protein